MVITPKHRLAVVRETMIGILINCTLPTSAIWLLGKMPPQSLVVGAYPIVADMLPAAGVATLMMTLMLTPTIRARVRRGVLPSLDPSAANRGILKLVPRPLILRALALAAIAVVLLVPLGLALVAGLHVLPLSNQGFALFNVLFGALVGAAMTPLITLTALADRESDRLFPDTEPFSGNRQGGG